MAAGMDKVGWEVHNRGRFHAGTWAASASIRFSD